ncbi:hypothetical protein PYW07_012469 [Mythimna separata]|uniref:Uncharacterized protein n=1 Tax=Mythimna separata TaxID=271217 RepID=A0AAD7YL90_MYTSE|nr:hypothetical protein PYW07_012469 [Mythimna separata]
MNGLALRINRGGGGKSKNSIGYSPIDIQTSLFENTDDNIAEIQAFIESPSSDDQLVILKKIIDANKDSVDASFMRFLVAAFFHAEAKHPIKCFISRHIIKNKHLQQPFSEALALQISVLVSHKWSDYKQYVDIANKLLTSIENFPAGVVALRSVQLLLAEYLTGCLECCVATLREQKTLSPTEKNEIFTLAHVSLRLLLHLVQKGTADDISVLICHFDGIRTVMQDLMFDDDVPMDTKSVCGILYLTMHVLEYGESCWTEVLDSSTTDSYLRSLLGSEAGRLCLYSAIPTVVPVDHLFTHTVDDGPAIVTLTNKILGIGDKGSSESAFILGVARTLLQISKLLDKLADSATGLTLVEALLQFAWGHLEHYMDSVRHLTGQLLGCVVKYCAKMDRAGKLLDKLADSATGLTLVEALLQFAWGHLEHYMDSVRHLTGQLLGCVVKYCAKMDRAGKLLDKLADSATGLTLVEALLQFAWGHLEHYMDSVRHLTGQLLGCVVKYCAKMDRAGKLLDKLADSATGLTLVEALLQFAWGHLEHYMDSVRHLTGQLLGCVVKYCAKMDRAGKLLDKLADSATGLTLVEALLQFAWGHLEHYMDSVRHLTGQLLGCVVKYCAKMDRAGKLLDKLADSATGLTLVEALLQFAWGHLEHYMDSVRHLTGQLLGCVVKYCAKMDRAGKLLDKLADSATGLTLVEALLQFAWGHLEHYMDSVRHLTGQLLGCVVKYCAKMDRAGKLLDKLADSATGLTLVEALLQFAWGHLEHYMDSVRHLTGQLLGCVVKYCAKMDRAGDNSALRSLTSALQTLERSRKSFYVCVSWLAGELSARDVLAVVRAADVIHALHDQRLRNTYCTSTVSAHIAYYSATAAELQ